MQPSQHLLLATAACAAAAAKAAAPNKTPNVMIVYADDLGYGDPGFAGHPSNLTPNLDALRRTGKRLTTWYSGCPVCTGSRASLMTGRVYARVGTPGVFGSTSQTGLPLGEVTIADQFKARGYGTAILGKWHLGQRGAYLPAQRGFDEYLGIPFSDDMGLARLSACDAKRESVVYQNEHTTSEDWAHYGAAGFLQDQKFELGDDPAGGFLPLVSQKDGTTTVVEQPVDLTLLKDKYAEFGADFIARTDQFFLYAPLSHVHTTQDNLPAMQYAGCAFRDTSIRGPFGDALTEADALVGDLVAAVDAKNARKDTVFIFSSDNGPWMIRAESAGSVGHLYARSAGYWNVGKGSTWEGGIREPAFVAWEGVIAPDSTTPAAVSALDLFPTLSALIGAPMPVNLTYNGTSVPALYDGVDQTSVFFGDASTSARDASGECLFFFGGPYDADKPSAARCGPYKLHYATGPGLGGCDNCTDQYFDPPMVFNVEVDPSEQFPLTANGTAPSDPAVAAVLKAANASLAAYLADYVPGELTRARRRGG